MNDLDVNYNYIQIFDKFDEIEQGIMVSLKGNDDLLKYLNYAEFDPLSMPMNDDIKKDMFGISSNIDAQRVFSFPSTRRTNLNAVSEMRVFIPQFRADNIYVGKVNVVVEIITHTTISKIRGGKRLYKMFAEVLRSLNGQDFGGVGKLRLKENTSFNLISFNDDFFGYQLVFETMVAACRD